MRDWKRELRTILWLCLLAVMICALTWAAFAHWWKTI